MFKFIKYYTLVKNYKKAIYDRDNERKEKNRLYYFLFKEGLYDRYKEFIKTNKKSNSHYNCKELLRYDHFPEK